MMHFNDQLLLEGDNGKAILLMHGISSGCAQMIPFGKMLNDYGYTVHCVNIAGHGTYPRELLRTSWTDMIDKAEYDFEQMRKHFDQVYVGGLSMGGCLALALGAKRTDLAGILSVSSPVQMLPGNFVTELYAPDEEFIHRDLAGKEGIARYYHIHYEEIAVRVCDELMNLMAYLREDGVLEKVTCPAFIAQAKDDNMADPASAKYIYDRIRSRDKVLYQPETGQHNLSFNEGRFDLMKAAVSFLKPF